MSRIQSVLFDKRYNTPTSASKWLTRNQMLPIKPFHTTNRYIRSRVNDPSTPMRTITLDKDHGIKAVINVGGGRRKRNAKYQQRRGGVIGSDLAVGAATVGSILAAIAAKKIYDKVKGKGLRNRTKPIPQRRAVTRGYGAGYLDSHPMLIESLITSALAGLAIAGIVKAAKK